MRKKEFYLYVIAVITSFILMAIHSLGTLIFSPFFRYSFAILSLSNTFFFRFWLFDTFSWLFGGCLWLMRGNSWLFRGDLWLLGEREDSKHKIGECAGVLLALYLHNYKQDNQELLLPYFMLAHPLPYEWQRRLNNFQV